MSAQPRKKDMKGAILQARMEKAYRKITEHLQAPEIEIAEKMFQQLTGAIAPTGPEPKEVFVTNLLVDGILFETVVNNDGFFKYASLQGGQVVEVPFVDYKGQRYTPPHRLKNFMMNKVLYLPSAAWASYVPTEPLLEEIQGFIQRYVAVQAEWILPISVYILHTWVYDRFDALSYLRFMGELATGKSRLLRVTSALCYKSLAVGGNITGAALFRSTDLVRGTLTIDESDFKNSDTWNDIIKILNLGYQSGGSAIIRCAVKGDFEPESFMTYGPKIIATRGRFDDEATESRCLTFQTIEIEIPAHIPLQLTHSFDSEAQHLRNKLLRWRFDNFHLISPQESEVRQLSSRLGQVGASLVAVTPPGPIRDTLLEFLKGYNITLAQDSDKTMVGEVLSEMRKGGQPTVSLSVLGELVNARLEGTGEQMSAKRLGSIIRSSFPKFKLKRLNKGTIVIF
jgi:hypothetical protein